MSAGLSPENAQYLQEIVARGEYASAKDALDEAVSLLRRREAFRRDVEVGRADARAGNLIPAEDVFDSIERELEEIEATARLKGE